MSGDLNEIMAEIVSTLKKHEVGGVVMLLDEKNGVYRAHLPTWSLVQFQRDGVVLRSQRPDLASEKVRQEAQLATANLISSLISLTKPN